MTPTVRPLVSIITLTYNHEKFIGACIDSVARQSYQNWEQIVIDDGSADGTPDIVRGFVDPRIHYVRQGHLGIEALPHTYNRALSLCHGQLVAILEGDDMWPPGKLSALIEGFDDQEVILAYGAVADIGSDGTWCGRLPRLVRRRMRLPKSILFNDPPGSATSYMLRADGVDLVPPSTVVIRRSALVSIGGFQYVPNLCVTDFPTFLRLSLEGKFYYTPTVMGYRRCHLASVTSANITTILTHAHQYAMRFLREYRFPLTAADRATIEASWTRPRPALEFAAGRLKLLNGEWRAARAHFTRALNPLAPRISAAALLGWLLSWLRSDLENLLALGGVARLDKNVQRESTFSKMSECD